MISIIVSSVNADLNRSFRQNVVDAIGVDFEFLIHDNTETGSYNDEWREATAKFINKWSEVLPYRISGCSDSLVSKCRQADSYRVVRNRLKTENMGAKAIYDRIGQILGLKYRFKIISHVIKAGVKRFCSNPAFSKNKERYA